MFTEKVAKVANFLCEKCEYNTHNKTNFNKHLLTSKHKKYTNSIQLFTQNTTIATNLNCDICNKIYKSRMGLWKHKKKMY